MVEFLLLFAVFYVWHAMGITIGYHRLLAHRSFSCPKFVEYFWILAGYLAFEGSPIWWCTIHRAHHHHVDTPLDPHSPRNGLLYAQFGWLGEKDYAPHVNPFVQSKDLIADPLYRFLEQGGNFTRSHTMGFATAFAFRGLIWYFFGWIPALASLLAGLAVLQIPLLLNVVCHIPKAGYKTYASEDDSVNVWWVGLLAMGEGWHNNHHASPGSARSGMLPHELDVSWWTILLMKKLGWVQRLNVASHEVLLERAEAAKIKREAAAALAAPAPVRIKVAARRVHARRIRRAINHLTRQFVKPHSVSR